MKVSRHPGARTGSSRGSILARQVLRGGEPWFEAIETRTHLLLRWSRAAEAWISRDGGRWKVVPLPGARPHSLRILRRVARAYARSLSGSESLHATALAGPHGSVALLGGSGVGKSTLAHRLMQEGWRLISDDLLAPTVHAHGAWLPPARAFLKLRSPDAITLGLDRSCPYDPNLERFLVPSVSSRSSRLRVFVFLDRTRKSPFRAHLLRRPEASLVLSAGMYNQIFRPPRVRKNQLHWAAQLARTVPLWKLTYPTGKRYLAKAAGVVERLTQFPQDPPLPHRRTPPP